MQVRPGRAPANADALAALGAPMCGLKPLAAILLLIHSFSATVSISGANGWAKTPIWINLEYVSGGYVAPMSGRPRPCCDSPAQGEDQTLFYPGFTPATGGLLREPDLLERQAAPSPPGRAPGWPWMRTATPTTLDCAVLLRAPCPAWLAAAWHAAPATRLLVTPCHGPRAAGRLENFGSK